MPRQTRRQRLLLLPRLQALARRVRGCLWPLQELPASAALAALRLWSAMLDCEGVRAGGGRRLLRWRSAAPACLAPALCLSVVPAWALSGSGVTRTLCRIPAAAWLASGCWQEQLEELLAVRQPSEDDLAEVGGHTLF